MSRDLQKMIADAAASASPFAPSSRYYGVPIAETTLPDGRAVSYVERRFTPPPEDYVPLREHVVIEGERLDQIAAAELGDPLLFWQIWDAAGVIWGEELIEPAGRRVRIPLPAGTPAPDEEV